MNFMPRVWVAWLPPDGTKEKFNSLTSLERVVMSDMVSWINRGAWRPWHALSTINESPSIISLETPNLEARRIVSRHAMLLRNTGFIMELHKRLTPVEDYSLEISCYHRCCTQLCWRANGRIKINFDNIHRQEGEGGANLDIARVGQWEDGMESTQHQLRTILWKFLAITDVASDCVEELMAASKLILITPISTKGREEQTWILLESVNGEDGMESTPYPVLKSFWAQIAKSVNSKMGQECWLKILSLQFFQMYHKRKSTSCIRPGPSWDEDKIKKIMHFLLFNFHRPPIK